jgi:hypothetical protein
VELELRGEKAIPTGGSASTGLAAARIWQRRCRGYDSWAQPQEVKSSNHTPLGHDDSIMVCMERRECCLTS